MSSFLDQWLDQAMAGSSGDLETDALVPAGVCTLVLPVTDSSVPTEKYTI